MISLDVLSKYLGEFMLKSIKFRNIYNFIEEQNIAFNSSSSAYVIYGNNAVGKTYLLDIIENVSQALYRKPDYENLKKVINYRNQNETIMFGATFEFAKVEYEFYYELDVMKQQYLRQKLTDKTNSRLLFDYQCGVIKSDLLTTEHIGALRLFNIMQNGVLFYIPELDDDAVTTQIKNVVCTAKTQDYIEISIGDLQTDSKVLEKIIGVFNHLDIEIKDINIYSGEDKYKKQIQQRIIDRKNQANIDKYQGIEANFDYGNYVESINVQSPGTLKIFDLCLELFGASDESYFVPRLIDEMGASLADDSFSFILNEFLKKANRQLIFTTNNQLILERKLLPKESIILIEKTENGSCISKLSDYKFVRNDNRHNWKKLYNNKLLTRY